MKTVSHNSAVGQSEESRKVFVFFNINFQNLFQVYTKYAIINLCIMIKYTFYLSFLKKCTMSILDK